MSWPLASHFSMMVQTPMLAFRDPRLQQAQIERDWMNQPRTWSGAFAVVFKATDNQGRAMAVRAFTSASPERRERYEQISSYLASCRPNCMVNFEYRDESIRSAGDGKWYPMLLMEWVEGKTLQQWVAENAGKNRGPSMGKAARHWLALADELGKLRIAHGDLQHGNVLVTREGRLKLVDYDGICVPALEGRRNLEIGIRPYQHPERNEATPLAANLDRFSSLLIYVALRALAGDPRLWTRYVDARGNDKLLFHEEDFLAGTQSPLYRDLAASLDPLVRFLAEKLFALYRVPMKDVPTLRELVRAGEHDSPYPISKKEVEEAGPLKPRVVLEVIGGPSRGQRYLIDRHDTFLFGRGRDCHARLAGDTRVSRHHFLLEANPPQVRLRDLGSLNGTWINGQRHGGRSRDEGIVEGAAYRHPAVDLRHGDEITVGDLRINVLVQAPVCCGRCGAFFAAPASEAHGAAGLLCEACLAVVGQDDTSDWTPRCERCGKDVRDEIPSGRHGAYLCEACRSVRKDLDESLSESPSMFQPVDGFQLRGLLGRGKLGSVYSAVRKADGRTVAIKILGSRVPVGPVERWQLLEEVEALQVLQHRNLLALLESGSMGSQFYFVSELCPGLDLERWRTKNAGKVTWENIRAMMSQCLDALAYGHGVGFTHGNIKPTNVLVDESSGLPVARFSDYGLAGPFERAGMLGLTLTGLLEIEYDWLPRERLTGFAESHVASDLWSLAAVFYQLLGDKPPRDFNDEDPIAVILNNEPISLRERNPAIPAAVVAVIDRALRNDPAARFDSAAQMKAAWDTAFG